MVSNDLYGDTELLGRRGGFKRFLKGFGKMNLMMAMPITSLAIMAAKKRRARRLAAQRAQGQEANLTSNPAEKVDMKELKNEASAGQRELGQASPPPSMPSNPVPSYQDEMPDEEGEPSEAEMLGFEIQKNLPYILLAGAGIFFLTTLKRKRRSR